MTKKKFRLATLQKIRKQHRDTCRMDLAKAHEAEQILAEQAAELKEKTTRLADFQQQTASAKTMDVNRLLQIQRFKAVVQADIKILQEKVLTVRNEIQRRRTILLAADRDVKSLEKHEEKLQEQNNADLLRQETKEIDEIASLRFIRQTR